MVRSIVDQDRQMVIGNYAVEESLPTTRIIIISFEYWRYEEKLQVDGFGSKMSLKHNKLQYFVFLFCFCGILCSIY